MVFGVTDFEQVKSNLNVSYRCWYHVVWCPKWRRRVLTSNDQRVECPPLPGDPGPVDERLAQIVYAWADETGSEIAGLEIMPDHVHLLVSVDPQYGIGKFVRMAKGRSSRLLRQEFPSLKRRIPTLWTNFYLVATVGGAPLDIVKRYVENQRNV